MKVCVLSYVLLPDQIILGLNLYLWGRKGLIDDNRGGKRVFIVDFSRPFMHSSYIMNIHAQFLYDGHPSTVDLP